MPGYPSLQLGIVKKLCGRSRSESQFLEVFSGPDCWTINGSTLLTVLCGVAINRLCTHVHVYWFPVFMSGVVWLSCSLAGCVVTRFAILVQDKAV